MINTLPTTTTRVRGTEILPTDSKIQYREKLARIAMDEMYQFVAVLDTNGTLLEVNRAALEGGGLKFSDVEGKPFWECFWWRGSKENQETLKKAIELASQGKFIRYDVEVFGRADGTETIIIDFSMIPVRDETGRVAFIVPEGRDITEKKAREREIDQKNKELQSLLNRIKELDDIKNQFFTNLSCDLSAPLSLLLGPTDRLIDLNETMDPNQIEAKRMLKESEEQFHTLINLMPQLIWMAKADGYVYWFNEGWYNYTGTTLKQMEGWGWQSLHDPKELPRALQMWKSSLETGRPFEHEFPLKGKDGVYRWFLTRASPIKNSQDKIIRWLGTNTDIEVQKQAIHKLKLERDLREKFVSTLTHDLRTPLTAAKMSAQLILRKADKREFIEDHASKIIQNVNRSDEMIKDLLDVNFIRAGGALTISPVECELRELLKDILLDLTTIHGDRFVLNAVYKIHGFWDPGGLRRIFENLINNAIKYGADHENVTILLEQKGERVHITVHNEGNPLSLNEQISIFEIYKRTGSAEAGNQRGWGLGLTLVVGITEAHGGIVRVESNPQLGTNFIVELPLRSK